MLLLYSLSRGQKVDILLGYILKVISGSSQLIFTTNSNTLVGHEVVNTITGIQSNTNISGVTTAAGDSQQ
jgi:hypothetical protein